MDKIFSEFDAKDFDAISYINTHFPTESSLTDLDPHIEKLRAELVSMNEEILSSIREHALINLDIQKQVAASRQTTENILKDVASIREKAEASEELVYDMCKDIKSLDIAKKNLTFSISALKKFQMMITAIEQLRDYCEKREYKSVANLISVIDQFFVEFKKYEAVSQIQELSKERDAIIRELKLQIIEDFTAFGQGTNTFPQTTMQEACILVEALGMKFRDEIVGLISKVVINPYNDEFSKSENAKLDVIERRYPWIQRKLKDIDAKYQGVFPHYWGIKCFILNEFCGVTRVHVTEILERQALSSNVDSVLKALQATLKFEQKIFKEMRKEYGRYLEGGKKKEEDDVEEIIEEASPDLMNKFHMEPTAKEFVINSLPRFKGSISNSFEQYMRPYVEKEEIELKDSIRKLVSIDEYDPSSAEKIFNSSLMMFNNFKQVLKRAANYSRTQTMFDIFNVFKRSLRFYSEELLIKMDKEEKMRQKEEGAYETFVCLAVNTAEYCKETVNGLADTVRQYLDSPFNEKVDMSNEETLFSTFINKALDSMTHNLDQKLEPSFSMISKYNYEKVTETGDMSEYVKEISRIVESHIKTIKPLLSEVYFMFYLNRHLVPLIQNKFLSSTYKIKKLPEMGIQKLQLDLYGLKFMLKNLIKIGIEDNKQISAVPFNAHVEKTFMKSENVLKLVSMTNDLFTENIGKILPDIDSAEVEKIMILKGLKKKDFPNLLDIFGHKSNS